MILALSVRHFAVGYILFSVSVVLSSTALLAKRRHHDGSRDGPPAMNGRLLQQVARRGPEEELPRRQLVDIIHRDQHFQDTFTQHFEPLKIQFGHVCEDPREWQQRFERRDFENNKHQGKVRWGNQNGEYGEHYWDLNHGE